MMEKSLNIAMISDDFLPGMTGVGVHLQLTSKWLVSRGHQVIVLTTRRGDQKRVEEWNGVIIYRFSSVELFGFHQAIPNRGWIAELFSKHAIDRVHIHYFSMLLYVSLKVAKKMEIPTVYTYHMTVDHLTQPVPMRVFRPMLSWLMNRWCCQFDHVLAPSDGLLKEIAFDSETPTLTFMPNPVTARTEAEVPVKERVNIDFVVLYVGRLAIEKNVKLLIQAFSELVLTSPGDLELWIVGKGSEEGRLKVLAEELNIDARVQFFGHVDHAEVSSYYRAVDVFVLPSTIETHGMVALEAMGAGIPVIVTSSIVSARELVVDGENGYIVNPVSSQELRQRLFDLFENSQLREKLGLNGLSRSLKSQPSFVLPLLEEFYQKIVR